MIMRARWHRRWWQNP
jgi:hypothetical protein